MKSKKIISIILSVVMIVCSIAGCSSNSSMQSTDLTQMTSYTDDLGRTVDIPQNIERVASSGPISDVFLYSVCPDKMVGFATQFPTMAEGFIPESYLELPVYGQYYGKNANMNIEALVAADPQVIIDIGTKKSNMEESLDSLQYQSGIPVIFIESNIESLDNTYNELGQVLNMQDITTPMAKYCKSIIDMANENSAKIDDTQKTNVYAATTDILTAISQGSINGTPIGEVGAYNVADFGSMNNNVTNQASKEQIMQWNPDVVLVDTDEIYNEVLNDTALSTTNAVQNDKVYKVPDTPYSFLGGPASVNQLLGVEWLGNLLYPDLYNYNMVDKIKEFYEMFYHCQPTDEQINMILENAE